jgi:hypothetical protein
MKMMRTEGMSGTRTLSKERLHRVKKKIPESGVEEVLRYPRSFCYPPYPFDNSSVMGTCGSRNDPQSQESRAIDQAIAKGKHRDVTIVSSSPR